jgi:hypothetical protein
LGKHGAVGEKKSFAFFLPLILDVDGSEHGEVRGHAWARHGRERRAAEHEVGAVGPCAVRDDHPGAPRVAELLVLAPDLRSGSSHRIESGKLLCCRARQPPRVLCSLIDRSSRRR